MALAAGAFEVDPKTTNQASTFLQQVRDATDVRTRDIALACLDRLAQQKVAVAALNLGTIYFHGNFGIAVDQKKAVEYWGIAAEAKDPLAAYNLGLCHLGGTGVEQNIKRGIALLKYAAGECRYPKAALKLAGFHHYGQYEVKKDLATALYLYYCAAKLKPILDPGEEISKQAKLGFVAALEDLKASLKISEGYEERTAFIIEGMRYERPLTLEDFQAAARGDIRMIGIAEGLFFEAAEHIVAEARTKVIFEAFAGPAATSGSAAASTPRFASLGWDTRHADPGMTTERYFADLEARRSARKAAAGRYSDEDAIGLRSP